MDKKIIWLAVMATFASGYAMAETKVDKIPDDMMASEEIKSEVNQLEELKNKVIKLEEIKITAPKWSDTKPVKGYHAKSSNTATKTDAALRDTPQSIAVITQDQIKDQSVQSVAEAIRYVPGVQAAQGEGNRDAVIFRGNASTGDFFMDGIRDDVQTYRDFYNTDRIEVLKGPNGMIFGRGGAGGVVNRVAKEAGWDTVKELTASYGAYNYKRIAGDVGQALTDDIAFRINTVYENSSSYRNGVDIERYGITPTFTVVPSDKTKITFGMEYFQDKRIADRGVPSVNGAGNTIINRRVYNLSDTSTFYGSARLSPAETETTAFNAMLEHAFDNGVGIKNRTRYANYNKFYQNVYVDSAIANNGDFTVRGYRDVTQRENLINQTDITYTAKWGTVEHKLLAGLELAKQDTNNSRLTAFFNNSNSTSVILNANTATQIGNMPVSFSANLINSDNSFRDNQSMVNVVGFYLQDQIILSPNWQAIVGLRHDQFKTDFNGEKKGAAVGSLVSESFSVSDSFISTRAGLIYKPVEPVSLYTNYSISYVPRAGDQLTSLTLTNQSFAPEKFINTEIGAKWDVTKNLSLTAAAYKLNRENIAVSDPLNTAQTILVDGQTTKGVELGIAGNVTKQWSLFGGYAYQQGEITEQQGAGAGAILQGATLAQTPTNTFSLWNRYDFNRTWGAAIGVISRSEMYAAIPTATQSVILPGYTRLDAAIYGKLSDKLRLQVNVENLTNKEYALYAHNNNNITPGSPISGRATLTYDF